MVVAGATVVGRSVVVLAARMSDATQMEYLRRFLGRHETAAAELDRRLREHGIHAEIKSRAKHIASIYRKMRRKELSDPPIDITPPGPERGQPGRKPGKFDNSVEEASVDQKGPRGS